MTTLDEMGPHAERGLPVTNKPRPAKTIDIPDDPSNKKHRHGRRGKRGGRGQ